MTDRHSTPALSALAGSTPEEAGAWPLAGSEPVLSNLDGDVVEASAYETVFLDHGSDAILTDPDGDPARLTVILLNDDDADRLQIHTDGNGISIDDEGRIWIDTSDDENPDNDIMIGELWTTTGGVS